LIQDLNDGDADAHRLAGLLRPGESVKLNRLNPVSGVPWQPSRRAQGFAQILRDAGLSPEHYCTDGVDVAAACGQLKSQVARARADRAPSERRLVVLT
jgi:adenine C2-methylase RlmN of 23S rRNA A2503 and tRNA A37